MCVTAFPVLARIVKEKQLFRTRVGVTTLSTAAWADVGAWTLLALSISLISGGSKLNILWTFICLIVFAVVMFGPVRWLLRKFLIRNGHPIDITPSLFAGLIVATLASSWITAYVGLHSIFGAFIFGIILPRDGGFCVRLAEKFEDFVTAFFLPLYFTASGLRTQLGLLDNGNTWGLLLLLVSVAIITKVGSGFFAARITGLGWRESFTLGVLMNTKGLVELIVLNIGLDNKLISPTTFSMMVVLALVTTFITSPVVHFSYPYSRIVEFENQTPGKTVMVAAVRDRHSVAGVLGVFAMISGGRPKRYRMRAVHTLVLPDRPSAYMTKSHTDEVLDHLEDLAKIITIRIKPLPLTYDDTESQKIEQLATVSSTQASDFFFLVRKIPSDESATPLKLRLGGSLIRKLKNYKNFHGNFVVLYDRGVPSNIKTMTFVYTGSDHDVQAARLAKGVLHTYGAHVNVIYAMNASVHPTPVTRPDEIKDVILAALFRKQRSATIDLFVVHDTDLTTGITNAINSLEDPGLVMCGCDAMMDSASSEGVRYRDVVIGTGASFLIVSKGPKTRNPTAVDASHSLVELNRDSSDADSANAQVELLPPKMRDSYAAEKETAKEAASSDEPTDSDSDDSDSDSEVSSTPSTEDV